jgi:cell division protein FtsW
MDDTGYQTVQSEIALASGGPIGVGPGAGRAKQVLPAATTDFILATIGEEFGLFGVLLVLCVLGALVIRLFQLAANAPNRFAGMVLVGVGSWIGFQTILNVMMVNATLPAIGVPLPFISSGGSSLVSLWLGVGLCQAVLQPAPEPTAEVEKKGAPNRNRWRNRRPRISRT